MAILYPVPVYSAVHSPENPLQNVSTVSSPSPGPTTALCSCHMFYPQVSIEALQLLHLYIKMAFRPHSLYWFSEEEMFLLLPRANPYALQPVASDMYILSSPSPVSGRIAYKYKPSLLSPQVTLRWSSVCLDQYFKIVVFTQDLTQASMLSPCCLPSPSELILCCDLS